MIQSEALWVNVCIFTDYKEAFPAPVPLDEASEAARKFIMVSKVYKCLKMVLNLSFFAYHCISPLFSRVAALVAALICGGLSGA